MTSNRKVSEDPRRRVEGLVKAAYVLMAVVVFVSAAVMLAPNGESDTSGGGSNQSLGTVYTVTYNIGDRTLNQSYNSEPVSSGKVEVRYYGTPVAEYNPQFWAGSIVGEVLSIGGKASNNASVEDWYKIESYPNKKTDVSKLTVFAGWSVGTETVDPGADLTEYDGNGDMVIELTAVWSDASYIERITAEKRSGGGGGQYSITSSGVGQKSGNKYQDIVLLQCNLSNCDLSSYSNATVRSDPQSGTKEITTESKSTGGNLIIDNVKLVRSSSIDILGGSTALYASGSLIIGTNVTTDGKVQVQGGWKSSSWPGQGSDHSGDSTDLVVFSGTYAVLSGGSATGAIGNTSLTLAGPYMDYENGKKLNVIGTVYGGNITNGNISGSAKILFVGGSVYDKSNCSVEDGNYQVIIGGSRYAGTLGTTEVILTGTSMAYMVQGGGRAADVSVGTAQVTIAGHARVGYMVCGSITDANTTSNVPVTKSIVTISDIAEIGNEDTGNGLVLGGGWDSYGDPKGSSSTGQTHVVVTGGTVHGSVYGGGFRGSVGDGASNPVTTVEISGGIVDGSVYAGGKGGSDPIAKKSGSTGIYSAKVQGNTSLTMTGGTVGGSVYGGGEGIAGMDSVSGSRSVTIAGGTVGGSVYGSSSLGNDSGDSSVVVSGGTVKGSLYGGGFKGTTTGSTSIALSGKAVVGMSIYGGADVGTLDDSTSAFTTILVTGDSEISIDGSDGATVTRSIFGSGNSCLIGGSATITIDSLTADPMESIQNAGTVKLTGSQIHLTGRSDGSTSQTSSRYSLNGIGTVQLIGGTYLGMEASVVSIGQLESYISEGIPSTSSSPSNTVRLFDGAVLTVKNGEGYQKVCGYVILSLKVDEQYYGALAYGSTASTGGFVVIRNGKHVVAENSDISDDCRCWYIAGTARVRETVIAESGKSESTATIDLPRLSSATTILFVGHTASGDRLELVGSGETLTEGKYVLTVGTGGIVPTGGSSFGQTVAGLNGSGQLELSLQYPSALTSNGLAGKVVLNFWEAVEVEIDGEKSWVAQNKINVELEVRTESPIQSEYQLDIVTADGEGSATFVIPKSYYSYDVSVSVSSALSEGMLYYAPAMNEGGTCGWVSLGSERSGEAAVGTLSGPFDAALTIRVDGAGSLSKAVLSVELSPQDGGTSTVFTIDVRLVDAGTCTVRFFTQHGDGGWDEPTTVEVTKGQAVPSSEVPATAKDFVGWYLDDTEGESDPVGLFDILSAINGDTDLYACYRWTVTFDFGDGTTASVLLRTGSEKRIGKPADPTRTGYDFKGWKNGDADAFISSDGKETISGDTTFVAQWEGSRIVVTYSYTDSADASKNWSAQVTYSYGQTYGAQMDEQTKALSAHLDGANVGGWTIGTEEVYGDTTIRSEDHTVEAYIVETPVLNVKLSLVQGSTSYGGEQILGSTDIYVQSGGKFRLSNATATGYELKGWKWSSGDETFPIETDISVDLSDGTYTFAYGVSEVEISEGSLTDGVLQLETVWTPITHQVVVEQPSEGEIRYGGSKVTKGMEVPYGTVMELEYVGDGAYSFEVTESNGESEHSQSDDVLTLTVKSDCVVRMISAQKVTVTVLGPALGQIGVTKGAVSVGTVAGGASLDIEADIGDEFVFGFDPLTSGTALYEWVSDATVSDGRLEVTGDAVVFAVLQLEGGFDPDEPVKRTLTGNIAESEDSYKWDQNGWDGVVSQTTEVDLEDLGYPGMRLTVSLDSGGRDSIAISGLSGVTGTVCMEDIAVEVGGERFSIDILLYIVPDVVSGGSI